MRIDILEELFKNQEIVARIDQVEQVFEVAAA